jgi:hypothetical protein
MSFKKIPAYAALVVVAWLVYQRFRGPGSEPAGIVTRWRFQWEVLPSLAMLVLCGLVLVALLWVVARLYVLRRRRRDHSWGLTSVSDKIRVQGWTASDLRWIAKDFAGHHGLPATFAALTREDETTTSLWFPTPIPVGLLLKLVAYIRSPRRFEIRNEAQAEALRVVGLVTITPAFRLPDESLVGQPGLLYAPAREHSPRLILMAVRPDKFFECSLRASVWERRFDPRMQSWTRKLWEDGAPAAELRALRSQASGKHASSSP